MAQYDIKGRPKRKPRPFIDESSMFIKSLDISHRKLTALLDKASKQISRSISRDMMRDVRKPAPKALHRMELRQGGGKTQFVVFDIVDWTIVNGVLTIRGKVMENSVVQYTRKQLPLSEGMKFQILNPDTPDFDGGRR